MAVLSNIEPAGVMHYFEEICSIPHGSFNTDAISDYLVSFANAKGLTCVKDDANNVIIRKPASKGMESSLPVIIQGHTDMVCEMEEGLSKDMKTEAIDLEVNGDLVSAKGTTLGGDDGIAVAMMLAILDSDIPHPELECIFTSDEEVGMLGAQKIDLTSIKGRRLLNIDSEVEGVFTVSCAGGANATCNVPLEREDYSGKTYAITVTGLIGGHSGIEIDKGRANSNALMGRVLYRLSKDHDIRIISVNGGLKANAIPNMTKAVIVTKDDQIEDTIKYMERAFKNEFKATDPGVRVEITEAEYETALSLDSTNKIITLLKCLPNGVMAMSQDIKGLVQTSLNMGILVTEADHVEAVTGVRSSIETQKETILDKIECLTSSLGGAVTIEGSYSGWEYKKESPLRELMIEVYKEQYNEEPTVEAIHAGLECGLFCEKIPDLDCISFGPNLNNIHTFKETMSVSSVNRVWNMLKEVLRRM